MIKMQYLFQSFILASPYFSKFNWLNKFSLNDELLDDIYIALEKSDLFRSGIVEEFRIFESLGSNYGLSIRTR